MRSIEPTSSALNLRAGEFVEVRGIDEIMATLDERAQFEALPFMPEMLKFVGRRFRVAARADRTCDRVERKGIRHMTDAVHLDGVRCNGEFHDGCDAACLIYWKEAWLKRVDGGADPSRPVAIEPEVSANAIAGAERVFAATRKDTQPADGTIYSCQATESLHYTSPPKAGQKHSYWQDIRCRNVRWHEAARAYLVERFNAFQQRRGGTQFPPLAGTQTTTPIETLDLKPGDLVQVRTKEEIVNTLDIEARNRGLSFDREMLIYCGGTYRVLKRVNKIIDEPTGKMMPMKRDCVILDGVVCKSRYHGLCQRAIYPFWREIWLKHASTDRHARSREGEGSFVAFVLRNGFQMLTRRLIGHVPRVRTEG